jgi:TusA-related sulfurtransferase
MHQETTCKQFDLRGQICPSTLLIALREVNSFKSELKSGTVSLLFLSDNRSSTTHISETVSNMGYKVQIEKKQGHYHILVSRSQ